MDFMLLHVYRWKQIQLYVRHRRFYFLRIHNLTIGSKESLIWCLVIFMSYKMLLFAFIFVCVFSIFLFYFWSMFLISECRLISLELYGLLNLSWKHELPSTFLFNLKVKDFCFLFSVALVSSVLKLITLILIIVPFCCCAEH